MKLSKKQLKQMINEELSELMYESDEERGFSFLMQDASEVMRDLKDLLPFRNPTRHPELAKYRDYLFSGRARVGHVEFRDPPLSLVDLIYQPQLRKEISQTLIDFKNNLLNNPVFDTANKLLMDLKNLSRKKNTEHRELFFSDDKYDMKNVSTILMGLRTHSRELDKVAEEVESLINTKDFYITVIDKNIEAYQEEEKRAEDLFFGLNDV